MKLRTLLSVVVIMGLAAVAALAADVSGTWKASMPGRGGQTMDVTFQFKVDGDTLTGSQSTQMGETEITEGKVAGDKISFKIKREFNGNTRVMVYEGTVSGNEIQFKQTMEGMDRPPREFTAKKAE